jgi:hypothetical protein
VDFRVWRRLQPANSSFQNANLLFQYGVQKSIEIYSNGAQKNPAALSMARQAVLRLQPCHGNFTAGETHGVGGFRPKFPKKNRVNQFPDSTMGKKYIAGLEKGIKLLLVFRTIRMAVVNLRLPLLQDPSLRLPSAKGNLAEEIVVLGEYRKNSMD